MVIHKGPKYTITTDGLTAVKSDGITSRHTKYYSERDISALAGEIDELTAWRIFHDVARQASASDTPVSPEHILIDGPGFVLSEWSESSDDKYLAPEGYSPVWALAATVFFVYLGCNVFQGLGGRGQSATAPIPTLRRDLPDLSKLIVMCLDYNPSGRPTLDQIVSIAASNIIRCQSASSQRPPLKTSPHPIMTADEIDTYWPEEMS